MKNRLALALVFTAHFSIGQPSDWPFRAALDSLVASHELAADQSGFSVVVVENGQIVFSRQSGLANLKTRRKITLETEFNFGSMSKQFTAMAIFLLEKQGKLRLSDPIQKYLPELPDFGYPISLDDLMHHVSGLHDHLEIMGLRNQFKNSRLSPKKLFEMERRAPILAFEPRTDFAYCNTGFMLLALVVERVSGLSLPVFMKKNIFQPLGMTHSRFALDEKTGLTDGTTSYFSTKKGFKKTKPSNNAMGATGLCTTLPDFVLWEQNFYKNHLENGSDDLLKAMKTPFFLKNGASTNYGGGLFLKKYRGLEAIEHGGGWNSFLVQWRQFPEKNLSVLVASNNDRTNPFPICDAICDRILSFLPLVGPDFSTRLNDLPVAPNALEGRFLSDNNRLRFVRQSHDSLLVFTSPKPSAKGIALSFQAKKSDATSLVFLDERGDDVHFLLKNGVVEGFEWAGGDYFRTERLYRKLDNGPAADLQKWAGKYRSKPFRQTARVKYNRRKKQLVLKPTFFLSYPLEPLAPTVFRVKNEKIILRFLPDGLILGHDWLQNIRLERL